MKPRYEILDGLRGVAAILVIVYHLYECFPAESWLIGHGYLAVDFFFILSGFVIGYAYDDRWTHSSANQKPLTIGAFFRRRIIRLHPMVIFGVVLGLITFCLQGATDWAGNKASVAAIAGTTLLGLFLIPNIPGASTEVRGNGEMYPLNGPHWSLFFEYIGNIAYALCVRRLSTKALAALTATLAVALAVFATADTAGYGNIGMGWTLDWQNFLGGMLRMSFSYSAGLLICRIYRAHHLRGAFWISAAILTAFAIVPFIAIGEGATANCLYEVFCIIVIFPIVLWIGASAAPTGNRTTGLCRLLGNLSYPLYAVHYPTMYLFYHYIGFPDTWRTPGECSLIMVALLVGNIALAYIAWRFYDAPLRRYLTRRFIK